MNLSDLAVFVAVARLGSISQAATERGLAKSTVSERVKALEAELRVQLLARSSRRLELTEAGERLYRRGAEILELADEAEQEVSRMRGQAVGNLRVSAPVSFGRRFLSDVLTCLLRDHPGLSMQLDLEDRDVDLIGERYDIAIRVGDIPPSGLSARRVGWARWYVVGSPQYLDERGRPEHPSQLKQHECLRFAHRRTPGVWTFDGPDGRMDVRIDGRLVCNHGDVLADTAAAGLGLAWLPDFITATFLDDGRLERVLEPYCDVESPVHMLFPTRRHRTKKVELFADALEAAFRHGLGADHR